MGSGSQSIFQAVGYYGTKLGVRQGEILGKPGIYLHLHTKTLSLAAIGGTKQIDRFVFTEAFWCNGIQIRHKGFEKRLCLFGFAAG